MWTFQESLMPGHKARFVLGGEVLEHDLRKFKSVAPPFPDWVLREPPEEDLRMKSGSVRKIIATAHDSMYTEARAAVRAAAADAWFLQFMLPHDRNYRLCGLLMATSGRACKDPRAKIYAVLGLLQQ
ncbi:uncharacterized protein B0I36DRAFT_60154 [Microdochium trichocladiopsis]|uniref:Uncharacterized protein n=1 Tax=Microdochium trichocladiopsis TaxID=1682393 RepID=A0A9P8XSR3_9PEZI|nr:uncharacterized protein B0I36DRAFT_60154 [Microdochium trichocladiopsis]KAH7009461.1 hypothetical protein B0I36DRAFT_60154 [Microdochium trichocladiopsis]